MNLLMTTKRLKALPIATLIWFFVSHSAFSQMVTFGSGANQFSMEFVPIGNADNPDDPNALFPVGRVEYAYGMGKYEISRDMITKANNQGGLGITMATMDFVTGGPRDDMPATGVSWFEVARFVNWLNESQGHQRAYNFDGSGNFQLWTSAEAWQTGGENLFRHKDAYYFLPSMDEWHKAAYYDPTSRSYFSYPTGSDAAPTAVASGTGGGTAVYNQSSSQGPADITLAGGLSPYGTMGHGGNVWEWEESEFDLHNNSPSSVRGLRAGAWNANEFLLLSFVRDTALLPSEEATAVGFRVASLSPEGPGPDPLLAITGIVVNQGAATLTWRSQPGHSYRVERSEGLMTWETVAEHYPAGGATGDSTAFTDPAPPSPRENVYYRVGDLGPGSAPPGAFAITGPMGTVTTPRPTITWEAAAGTTSYEVRIARNLACENLVDEALNVIGTSYTVDFDLPNRHYVICVTAKNGSGSTEATNNKVIVAVDVPSGYGPHHVVFVSEKIDIDASQGADFDVLCSSFARNAGLDPLDQKFQAIVSTSTLNARDKISITAKVLNTNGAQVASTSTQFWEGILDTLFNYDENGKLVTSNGAAWTGMNGNGRFGADSCQDWTTNSFFFLGRTGSPLSDVAGTWQSLASNSCSVGRRLYCISPLRN